MTMIGFSPLRAQITEYAVPFNGLGGIAAGLDGSMWFSGNGHIGRITTAGVVTSYQLPTSNAGSAAITAGPDGAMWFTESGNSGGAFAKIGRIATSGVFTEYPLPDSNSIPSAIATGPDGALWFIESGNGKIGRITTSGTITEISLPASEVNSGVYGITAGPDGNLWFTENYGADKIVRMTTSGVFTVYTVATFVNAGSLGITAGPDGALWFADELGKIGRITTSGTIIEYALPNNDSPFGIAAGPDGALWFTDFLGQIGRITASGTVTLQVATPTNTANGFLSYIAAGPDGAMWFTELGGKIGRIQVPQSGFVCTNTAPPVITSIDSAGSYGGYPYFASGSWLEIFGSNLADPAGPHITGNGGLWASADFTNSVAPTSLDGISVSVNGKPAYVWFLSPTQINVQAPEDSATGNVSITVTNCKATSSTATFTRRALAPGLLAPTNYIASGKQYLVATFASDGAYVLNTSTGAAFGLNSRPAKPGDVIVAYGIGFGDVTPSILPGIVVQQSNALVDSVTVSFGSAPAALSYAGLAGSFIGLYEFYIKVPVGLADGDYQINVTQNASPVPQTIYLTVHN